MFFRRVGRLSAKVQLSYRLRDGLVPLHIVCLAARRRLNKRTLQLQRVVHLTTEIFWWQHRSSVAGSNIENSAHAPRIYSLQRLGNIFEVHLWTGRISRISLPGDRAHVPDLSQRQLAGSPEGGLFYCLARSLFPKQHAHPQSLFMCT